MQSSRGTNASSSRRKSTVPAGTAAASSTKDATRLKIEQMEQERSERRKSMSLAKQARKEEQRKNLAAGNPGDVDFIGMVTNWRASQQKLESKRKNANKAVFGNAGSNICIAVRKRPVSDKERNKLDHDSISCFHPAVWVHSAKLKVDGITKYLTHTPFQFDHTFGEDATTEDIYMATTMPLIDHVLGGRTSEHKRAGRATVFCYGQTGSGKTYTMNGIQQILAEDLYGQLQSDPNEYAVTVAFFELYSGFIQDLLHQRKRCKLLEDGQGEVNVTGLQEVSAATPKDFLQVLQEGNSLRTTHSTEANDTSSRSHAICQIFIRDKDGKLRGKLSLVDLAGSERGSDTKSHNIQRRSESADINTSLLSLKECIRALGQKSAAHVPYRGSKLTLILKDCFSKDSKTTMIATVSPGAMSTDHSLNTLRYADRIKERKIAGGSSTTEKSVAKQQPGLARERLSRISAAASNNDQVPFVPTATSPPQTVGSVGDLDSEDSELQGVDPDVTTSSVPDDEEELRRTVQTLFELEEAVLNQHMSNIHENAEMLTKEGKLLHSLQANDGNKGMDGDKLDDYAIQLADFLDRKEMLIYKLQSKLGEFQTQLAKEQELAKRVTKLTQY